MPIREETQIKKETESKPRRRSSTLSSQSISESQDSKKRKSSKIVKINKEKKQKSTDDDSKFKEEILNDVKNDYPNEFANVRMEEENGENEENQQEQANDLIYKKLNEILYSFYRMKVAEQLATINGETNVNFLKELNQRLIQRDRLLFLFKLENGESLGIYINEKINSFGDEIKGSELHFLKFYPYRSTDEILNHPNKQKFTTISLTTQESEKQHIYFCNGYFKISYSRNHLWFKYLPDLFERRNSKIDIILVKERIEEMYVLQLCHDYR